MAMMRVYFKKQVRLDRLSFPQRQMFKIGNVGVAAMKHRVQAALGPDDRPAKPLTKQYAIWKTKLGKGNRRNLTLSGNMLRNFQVRVVSENKAKASNTTRKDRDIKARANNQTEPWIVLSPRNRLAVKNAVDMILREGKPRLILERALGGKQR